MREERPEGELYSHQVNLQWISPRTKATVVCARAVQAQTPPVPRCTQLCRVWKSCEPGTFRLGMDRGQDTRPPAWTRATPVR